MLFNKVVSLNKNNPLISFSHHATSLSPKTQLFPLLRSCWILLNVLLKSPGLKVKTSNADSCTVRQLLLLCLVALVLGFGSESEK